MRALAVCACSFACTSSVDRLTPESADAGGGALDAKPDIEPKPTECPTDASEANRLELWQIGFSVSQAVVKAQLRLEDGQLVARIDRVLRGASFLERSEARFELSSAERSTLDLPGEYFVGFRGNTYPLAEGSWWQAVVVAPAQYERTLEPAMGYRARGESVVASVQIVRTDEDRAYFRVIEVLWGTVPGEFADNWSRRVFSAPFPGPSEDRWLATLWGPPTIAQDVAVGSVIDFRPDTAESRELVLGELRAPHSPFAELPAFAELYRTSWTFASSPNVVGTTVTSLADECCTGAGGTYVAHQVDERLRGAGSHDTLWTGGHAYYGTETCGDSFLLALDSIAPSDLHGQACDPRPVIVQGTEASRVTASLRRDARAHDEVAAWLAESPPLYRLFPDNQRLSRADASPAGGWWARPRTVEEALASATVFALFIVREVDVRDAWTEVTLETTFAPELYEHLPRHRVKLAFECGDPRLLRRGSEWLGALVYAASDAYDPAGGSARAFLVPGVLLPNFGTTRAIQSAFGSELASVQRNSP